ncbi:MAG: glycosyltransferase family 25 protein [Neisseriaceae bacterium]
MTLPSVFILSLPDAIERRKSAASECRRYQLDYEWIDAVDFRNTSFEEVASYYQPSLPDKRKNKILSPTEIACALGHQSIYQHIVKNKIPFSLILEDDFMWLANPHPLLEQLDWIQQHLHFDVLILGYVKLLAQDLAYHYRRLPLHTQYSSPGFRFGYLWEQFSCGTVGYIVTFEGAKKLSQSVIRVTADNWLYFEKACKVSIKHMRPLLVLEQCGTFQSTIRVEKDSHLRIKKSSRLIRSTRGVLRKLIMNGLGRKR